MIPREYRAQIEEELTGIGEWSREKAMIAYRLLYTSRADCRMDGIEQRIDAVIAGRYKENESG